MLGANESASRSVRSSLDRLTEAALDAQWQRWPGLRESFTDSQYRNTVRDTRYHLEFLASALWSGEQALYDDYVRWVKVLFVNLGLPQEWLTGSLEDVRTAVQAELPPDQAAGAASVIDQALVVLDSASAEVPTFLLPDEPLNSLLVRYLGAVLGADRHGASKSVLDAVEAGTSVRDIYSRVLQPAQLELGRLWQQNRITVAQEHYATAVTQMVMAQLYSRIFTDTPKDRTLVGACVGEELHEVGLRMVVDFFEMDGWNTHYLGASVPASSIVSMVADRKADVLALSATMAFHVEEVAEIIQMLRGDERTRAVKVLVGGYSFNLAPGLWRRVGADACAADAETAVRLGEQLLAS